MGVATKWKANSCSLPLSSIANLQVTFPFDVIKTRMQSAATYEEAQRVGWRPGMWTVARNSIRAEGWGVMVAGLWPTIVR